MWELHIDNISQRARSMVRDANGADVALHLHVFMCGGIEGGQGSGGGGPGEEASREEGGGAQREKDRHSTCK